MTDIIEGIVQIESSSENLLRLLKCREQLSNSYLDSENSASKRLPLIEEIIDMELNIMYIESKRICLPIIDEYLKEVNKPKEVKNNIKHFKDLN